MEEPSTSTPQGRPKLEEPEKGMGESQSQSQSQSQQEVKKTRKKGTNKQQRQVKREDKFYKELYKPKDSHISLLDPELFQRIKGNATSNPSTSSSRSRRESGGLRGASEFRFNVDPTKPTAEFPSLGTDLVPNSRYQSTVSTDVSAESVSTPGASTSTPPQEATPSSSSSISKTKSPAGLSFSSVVNDEKPLTPVVTAPSPSPTSTPLSSPCKQTPNQKLSKTPLVISLGDLIKSRKVKDKHIIGKQIGKKKNERSSVKRENFKLTVGNLLDSSGNGIIHRGKIRLKPKKPSKLKKTILKSREMRKSGIPGEASSSQPQSSLGVPDDEGSEATLVTKCDIMLEIESQGDGIIIKTESGRESNEVRKWALKDDANSGKERKPSPRITTESPNETKESEIVKAIMEKAEVEATLPPPVSPSIVEYVKMQMHSRKFRPYCDMWTSKELHGLVIQLLKELHRLQDRLYQTDPIKFKTKRRYVNGLKDVVNFLKINKAQMVILAPDIEPSQEKGGLDDKVTEILELAREKNVPYIFSGGRFILGKPIRNKAPVSAIAIVDKQSQEEQFNKILEAAAVLREEYQSTFQHLVKEAIKLNDTFDKKPACISINSALNTNFKSK